MYNKDRRGDANLLTGISILISFIFLIFLIAIIPLKVEKKPLYILTGLSAFIVLLALFSGNLQTWWYGMIVFVGLLLALAILIGKKLEWLKPIDKSNQGEIHKPFPMDLKEAGKGHSVFEEDFQQVLDKDFVAARLLNIREETQQDSVLAAPIVAIEAEKELKQEEYIDQIIDVSYENEESEHLLGDLPDYEEMLKPETLLNYTETITSIEWTSPETEKPDLDDSTLSLEVEELSDEWLRTRLDALYGEEEVASFEDQLIQEDNPYYIQPSITDIEVESPYTTDEVQEYTTMDNVQFEDLSKLYYNGQRGGNDGTEE